MGFGPIDTARHLVFGVGLEAEEMEVVFVFLH